MPDFLRPGDTIRASWLNGLMRDVNSLKAQVRQLQQALGDTQKDMGMGGVGLVYGGAVPNSMPTSLTWTEVAATRSSASKVITDSNSDTHTIDQATKIRMTASSGGVSYSWTFNFATS